MPLDVPVSIPKAPLQLVALQEHSQAQNLKDPQMPIAPASCDPASPTQTLKVPEMPIAPVTPRKLSATNLQQLPRCNEPAYLAQGHQTIPNCTMAFFNIP